MRVGTKVRYAVGRGFGTGTIDAKSDDNSFYTIKTEKGKLVQRRAEKVQKLEPVAE
jgi:hypothetical protein